MLNIHQVLCPITVIFDTKAVLGEILKQRPIKQKVDAKTQTTKTVEETAERQDQVMESRIKEEITNTVTDTTEDQVKSA